MNDTVTVPRSQHLELIRYKLERILMDLWEVGGIGHVAGEYRRPEEPITIRLDPWGERPMVRVETTLVAGMSGSVPEQVQDEVDALSWGNMEYPSWDEDRETLFLQCTLLGSHIDQDSLSHALSRIRTVAQRVAPRLAELTGGTTAWTVASEAAPPAPQQASPPVRGSRLEVVGARSQDEGVESVT